MYILNLLIVFSGKLLLYVFLKEPTVSVPTPCRVLRQALLHNRHYKKFLPPTFGYSEGEDHSLSLPQE